MMVTEAGMSRRIARPSTATTTIPMTLSKNPSSAMAISVSTVAVVVVVGSPTTRRIVAAWFPNSLSV